MMEALGVESTREELELRFKELKLQSKIAETSYRESVQSLIGRIWADAERDHMLRDGWMNA